MTELATLDAYGVLTEPATLTIQRLLPGPIERVWAYLTESERRRQLLAAGQMEMKVGAPFELVWRNDELSDPVFSGSDATMMGLRGFILPQSTKEKGRELLNSRLEKNQTTASG